MKYDDNYIYSKDIDWFCIINGYYVHVASAGGMIPDAVNDRENLREMQRSVNLAPDIYSDEQIRINTEFLVNRFPDNLKEREDYLKSFMTMARKGFISIDRTNIADKNNNLYHVVCIPPTNGIKPQILNLQSYRIDNVDLITSPQENISLHEIIEKK